MYFFHTLLFGPFVVLGAGQGQLLTKAINDLDLNYILKYSERQKILNMRLVFFQSF